MTERLALPSGGWADLHTTVTFGRQRAVRTAMAYYRSGTPEENTQAPAGVIVGMTAAWSFEAPVSEAAVDDLDYRDTDALFERAAALYAAATTIDPKANATSDGGPPAPE